MLCFQGSHCKGHGNMRVPLCKLLVVTSNVVNLCFCKMTVDRCPAGLRCTYWNKTPTVKVSDKREARQLAAQSNQLFLFLMDQTSSVNKSFLCVSVHTEKVLTSLCLYVLAHVQVSRHLAPKIDHGSTVGMAVWICLTKRE